MTNSPLLHSLTSQHATPFYLYDAATIRSRCGELAAFDVVRYAQKACSNTAILKLLRADGIAVDAVSANEIRRGLRAGFTAAKDSCGVHGIVYTADIFDADALDLVVRERIHVNCGSLDMIEQYGQRCNSGGEITLRINPGFGHGHSRKTNTGGDSSKHGIWFTEADEAKRLAAKHNLRITGLHVHIGSGTDLVHLAKVCDFIEQFAPPFGETLTTISAGGGLPVPYRPEDTRLDITQYHKLWSGVRERLSKKFGRKLILEVEPGRYLVAESGVLVATICAVKTQGENKFYLTDAGFNDLARAAMYGAYHPISILHRNENAANNTFTDVIVGGPLCESGDIFTQEEGGIVVKRSLPHAAVGDFLIIENAGAYGAAMSSNYNSRPLIAEFLVDGDCATMIRRRQTFDDIVACEV
ncbi:MAG: diaminopimelate decarboxylase [Thermoguttaceae bacterium]